MLPHTPSRQTGMIGALSEPVTFSTTPAAAFALTRSDYRAVAFTATAAVVGGVTVVTLDTFTGPVTESGSLADGRYTLRVLAAQVSADGLPLDADGDGHGGDDFSAPLYRFYGDATGDA